MFKNCETIVKKCNVFTMRIPEEKGAEKNMAPDRSRERRRLMTFSPCEAQL